MEHEPYSPVKRLTPPPESLLSAVPSRAEAKASSRAGVALKREGEVRFLIGQQRAVKGDAVFFKKRAELLDAALVRVALPGAAAEQQEEQKRVDKQQNDDDDIFEPRGFHVRASFPERSVGKPADADGVRAVLVVADVQLGAQILAVRDGRGLAGWAAAVRANR